MSIAGVIAAVVRQDAPYQAEIQMGAQLILDFQGARSGGRPYYWLRGTRYADIRKVPGWTFSRTGAAWAEDTTGRFVAFNDNEPRITDRGLLVEEARANSVFYSEDMANAYWSKVGVTASVVADPLYGSVARINNDAQGSIIAVHRGGLGFADAAVVTRSVLVKSDGAAQVSLRSAQAGTGGHGAILLNFATGSTAIQGTAVAGGAQAMAGGWFRLWFTMTTVAADANTTGFSVRLQSSTTDPINSGALIKFAQAEVGAFMTSPIVTNGSAATRAADTPYIIGLEALLAGPHTLAVAWEALGDTGIGQVAALVSDGGVQNREFLFRANGGQAQAVITEAGVQSTAQSVLKPGARTIRQALRSRAGTYLAAVDNVLGVETAKSNPPNLSRLHLGISTAGGSSFANGYIQVADLLGDVTEAQLQRLAA